MLARIYQDSVPSVMNDSGLYRAWWCGATDTGNHILYAEATSPAGPWHGHTDGAAGLFDDVFGPTGDASDFDGTQTCNPSVIRVGATYYLYYSGFPTPSPTSATPDEVTRIGVATSADGLSWTRANGGKAIVAPVAARMSATRKEGASQPSVAFVGGQYHLAFSDTTAPASNAQNGGGVFVMRSPDPTFQNAAEDLTSTGFTARMPATRGAFALMDAFSIDWAYSAELDAFFVARDSEAGKITLTLFDRTLSIRHGEISIAAAWREGPGLVTTPDRRMVRGASCSTQKIDILRPVGAEASTWDLAHVGVDLDVTGLAP